MTKKEFIDKYTDEIPTVSCEYIPTRDGMLKDLEEVISASKLHQPTAIDWYKDIPTPYKWLKEEKWKIPQGATYYEPKVTLTQCAGWITEYIKKYYFKTL